MLDQVLEKRFNPNSDILKDCSWLDPKKFPEIADIDEFPTEVLCTICHLTKVDRNVIKAETVC